MKAADFFILPESLAQFRDFFDSEAAPWTWIPRIGQALAAQAFDGAVPAHGPALHVEGPVHVHPTAILPHTGTLIGPIWIGPGSRLLPGCFLRGNVIVGAGCTVGHCAEIKNSLLLDDVQVPHHPYVGDSILGNGAHLGAGVVLSNLRLDQKNVAVRLPTGTVDSGLRKFGAILGDGAEVGCNAVLNPGTVMGRRALVTPGIVVGGYVPPATIAHSRARVSLIPRRD